MQGQGSRWTGPAHRQRVFPEISHCGGSPSSYLGTVPNSLAGPFPGGWYLGTKYSEVTGQGNIPRRHSRPCSLPPVRSLRGRELAGVVTAPSASRTAPTMASKWA